MLPLRKPDVEKVVMAATRLSPKHQAFVREYVKDWNGTQAQDTRRIHQRKARA